LLQIGHRIPFEHRRKAASIVFGDFVFFFFFFAFLLGSIDIFFLDFAIVEKKTLTSCVLRLF
jgi:hypothetical protein